MVFKPSSVRSLFVNLLAHAPIFVSAAGRFVDNGRVVTINDVPYYVGGVAIAQIKSFPNDANNQIIIPNADLAPMTVIHTSNQTFGAPEFNSLVAGFSQQDDVFQGAFLATTYLAYTGNGSAAVDMRTLGPALTAAGNGLLVVSAGFDKPTAAGTTQATLDKSLPNGPYFISTKTGNIFRAYRLYPDDNMAFISGIVSDEAGGFLSLPAVTENVMTKSIAVPSRLYYTTTAEKPLAGLRLGVKDIYHVKGIKTSGGNRAYYYLYGTQNATGPAVQRLVDQGAILVGKMGTVQFANGDNPTADWVDLHCPFNPRGDGYQSPSGSSSGSAAGMGAYPWLDIAIGTDTGGSMRGPSGIQGLFGNRPSTGAISMEHVIPLSPPLDTAGVFARSGVLWSKVTHAWYTNFTSDFKSYPKNVYWSPSYSIGVSTAAKQLLEGFVKQLETFLGANHVVANVSQQWTETHAADAPDTIDQLLTATYATLISVDQFNLLASPFYADYGAVHNGERPFINPGPLSRWNWGQANGGDAAYKVARQNMTIFRSWWEKDGYGKANSDSCSEGLFLYPQSVGATSYRNTYFGPPTGPPLGFGDSRTAVLGGTPEVVVPLGEVPYNSTITLKTHYLPVTMSIQAARGCDLMLANLVRDLEESGILKPVSTGPRLY